MTCGITVVSTVNGNAWRLETGLNILSTGYEAQKLRKHRDKREGSLRKWLRKGGSGE